MRSLAERWRISRWGDWIVVVTLCVVPFHAFLTVWASTAVGHFTLLRLWDEVALGLLLIWVGTVLWRDQKLRYALYDNYLVRVIALYVLLTVVLGLVALAKHEVVWKAFGYALVVNLRFLVWMLAVWVVASRSNWLLRHWRRLVFIPLGLTVCFGLLQFFVLPHDFLLHFGYNKTTSYVADVTLNQDSATQRVQSFLRGANQFGAYLVCGVGLAAVCLGRLRTTWKYWVLGALAAVALFITFSRSAWLGMLVTLLVLGWYAFRTKRRWYLLSIAGLAAVALGGLAVAGGSGGVQNAIFHANGRSTATVTSNAGHETALRSSLRDLASQPLGGGPGSAGQASVYNTGHVVRNTESYWLQTALETGWAGLIVLATILLLVWQELRLRPGRLALGLSATLIGLLVVNFFAYGWVDDTLAFVWWGLVGVALGSVRPETERE